LDRYALYLHSEEREGEREREREREGRKRQGIEWQVEELAYAL
jgi:hypothetical protein